MAVAFVTLPTFVHANTRAHVVIDSNTGFVLAGSNLNRKLQPASLVKVASAMVALDWLSASGRKSSELVGVPPYALSHGGANPTGLNAGDTASLRDLLYASLMASDNSAITAIAVHVGKDLLARGGQGRDPMDAFVFQMNQLAAKLGMRSTRFTNAHGLDHTGDRPVSTVADLARLGRYADASEAFRFYVTQKTRDITVYSAGQSRDITLSNTNELIGRAGIDGIKTGMTSRSGGCLILSSSRPPESRQQGDTVFLTPRRLVVVLLGSDDRFSDGLGLVQQGWGLHEQWSASGRPIADPDKLLR